ncbi:MAG: PilZ domain-containing protein [Methylophaga sp.]|nr:PilZ domain-containing protein [Methylophaga sp.]
MSDKSDRRHDRVKHRANIRVLTLPEKVYVLEMRDFSDSGLYVFCDDEGIVKEGDSVEVQTLEIEDAPILPSKVIRIDKTGFAVEFDFD